ncbi:MAG: cysteine-rich small domain-containing protein [Erysipelotrichaceae bacterium]
MSHQFFCNQECEYYPCHKGIKEGELNCLFCFCPLYVLGESCGGNFRYLNGIKDCSECLFPHIKENYSKIIDRYPEISNQMEKQHKVK